MLLRSIAESLDSGFILFNSEMVIQYCSPIAARYIEVCGAVDLSLAAGTDSKVNWNQVLSDIFEQRQLTRLSAVRYCFQRKNRVLDILCTPILDARGGVSHGAVVLEDVTDKTLRENAMFQAERLISIGKVAGKVAHELNNPMDGILRYLNLAIRVLEQGHGDKARDYLIQSRNGLMRMVGIISELLEFSRGTHQAMDPAPLDKIVDNALDMMSGVLSGLEVGVEKHYDGHALMMRNDNLCQVFCNLIKNAADVMGGKGVLTIAIRQEGSDWLVQFQDTGPGVPPELMTVIFQPFFTTKASGRGTGLGLAICKDIVEKHHGTISVECPPAGGSIFTVRLPAASGLSTTSS
ncbi:MAG: GHKL domain-containing protein [Sedimentisphaerales bacterium]|nr:GHKL domain-containing protein [Sedimentisphaerales bacterium]